MQAAYAYSVASSVELLRPARCWWVFQTVLLGYPALRILLAAANTVADEREDVRWGICWSMMVASSVAESDEIGGGEDGEEEEHEHYHGCRGVVHDFVESTKLQLVILVLVLVDVMAVAFEIVVIVNLVHPRPPPPTSALPPPNNARCGPSPSQSPPFTRTQHERRCGMSPGTQSQHTSSHKTPRAIC